MKFNKYLNDREILNFLLIALAVLIVVTSFTYAGRVGIGAILFPVIVGLALIISVGLQVVTDIKEGGKYQFKITEGEKKILVIVALSFAYILLIKYVNYILLLPVFIMTLLSLTGEINMKVKIILTLTLTIFSYIVFYRLLSITYIY